MNKNDPHIIFETDRLAIRLAMVHDADMYYRLWTDPRVMTNVGFPNGLPTTHEEILEQIAAGGSTGFDELLVVELKSDGQAIGECKLGRPNPEGIATTDVKLLPEFWGNRYGVEVKRGLVDYLFSHTDCLAVEATPNINNPASIKMQEAVGGVRVGEETGQFPESMRSYTKPVHYYIYRVYREDWQQRR